jgi:hypothetical protein
MQPGGPVTIRTEGTELVISGGRRTLRTDQCLDAMPTLAREAHSTDGQSWRTRCSTPPNDPRHAVINAAYFSGGDTLTVAETGRYEFTINDSRCIADVQRATSLRRVVLPAPSPVASTTAPTVGSSLAVAGSANVSAATAAPRTAAAPARADCSSPGDPVRLEVRPSRKLLRLGDEFTFRALVVDAIGCGTGTPIQWSVANVRFPDGQLHAAQPAIDASGRLSVPSADFADATFDVVAAAAGRSTRASVQAVAPANYEALLAQSGLDANGERAEPAVAILATGSLGGSDVRAEDGAHRRRLAFIVVVGALVVLLGIVAAIGARRAKKGRQFERAAEERHSVKLREFEREKRDREDRHAAQMRAHLESVARAQQAASSMREAASGPMFCPSCRREYPPGTTYCPFDSNRLVAVAGHEDMMTGPAGGICPTCKRGFNPGVKVCPHDGDDLVPPVMVPPPATPAPAPRGKICPTCGDRFDGVAAFCGKDGTQLVLLN